MREGDQQSVANSDKMGRIGDRPYWMYMVSLLVRVGHQIGAAVFLAACLLDAVPGPSGTYVTVAVLSGGLLFVLEWWRHRQLCREVAGVITIVKIPLLGMAYHGLVAPQEAALAAFIIASVGAHAPKRMRHRLLF